MKTSNLHKELAGYNAARGDFDWESDNLAEMELNGIDVNGDDLYQYLDLDIEYCDSTTTDDLNLLAALTSTALQAIIKGYEKESNVNEWLENLVFYTNPEHRHYLGDTPLQTVLAPNTKICSKWARE